MRLLFVKLFTLFRPDTKTHSLFSAAGVIKSLLVLPALFFLAALLLPGRQPLSFDDKLLLVVELLYILPFLITNSDPRLRVPLDALLLLHLVSLLYRRSTSRLARGPCFDCTKRVRIERASASNRSSSLSPSQLRSLFVFSSRTRRANRNGVSSTKVLHSSFRQWH
jgi:hypothetical protein